MLGQLRRLRRRRSIARNVAATLAVAGFTAIVAVLAVATVSQISPASGSYRATVDRGYAALSGPLVSSSNSSATELESLMRRGPALDRVTFFAQIDSLASATEAVARQFAAITPPAPAVEAGADCESAIRGRASAANRLRSALEGVLGGRTGTGSGTGSEAMTVAAMQSVGAELSVDDAMWAHCRRSMRLGAGGARLAASTWVTDPSMWAPGALDALVSDVSGSPSLAAEHRLAVLNTVTSPAPSQRSASGILVPPTMAMGLRVLVADEGNVDETAVAVAASVTSSGPATGTVSPPRSGTVSPVGPVDVAAGRQVAVAVPALAVAPGASYTLEVTVTSSAASESPTTVSIPVTVATALTTMSVQSSAPSVTVGHKVTYTASISAMGGLPRAAGTIAFADDGAPIAACSALPVSSASAALPPSATCTVTYPAAVAHAVTADYSGDPSRSASTSAPVIENVVSAPTGTGPKPGKRPGSLECPSCRQRHRIVPEADRRVRTS